MTTRRVNLNFFLTKGKRRPKREIGKHPPRLIRERVSLPLHANLVTSRWLRYAIRPIKPCSSGLVAAICHWPRERHAKYAFKGSSATGRWSFIPILVTNNSPRDAFGIRVQRGGSTVRSFNIRRAVFLPAEITAPTELFTRTWGRIETSWIPYPLCRAVSRKFSENPFNRFPTPRATGSVWERSMRMYLRGLIIVGLLELLYDASKRETVFPIWYIEGILKFFFWICTL